MKIPVNKNIVFNCVEGEFEALPEILEFSIDRSVLTDENPAIVTWRVKNASAVYLDKELVLSNGERAFHTDDFAVITLWASNQAGKTETMSLYLDIDRTPPVVQFFNIDIQSTILGTPIMLTWKAEDAHRIVIDNGVGDVTGKESTTTILEQNGLYNLIASSYFGYNVRKRADIRDFPIRSDERVVIGEPKFNFRDLSIVQANMKFTELPFGAANYDVDNIVIRAPKFNMESKMESMDMSDLRPIELHESLKGKMSKDSFWSKLTSAIAQIVENLWERK